jgi:hypothetical protein
MLDLAVLTKLWRGAMPAGSCVPLAEHPCPSLRTAANVKRALALITKSSQKGEAGELTNMPLLLLFGCELVATFTPGKPALCCEPLLYNLSKLIKPETTSAVARRLLVAGQDASSLALVREQKLAREPTESDWKAMYGFLVDDLKDENVLRWNDPGFTLSLKQRQALWGLFGHLPAGAKATKTPPTAKADAAAEARRRLGLIADWRIVSLESDRVTSVQQVLDGRVFMVSLTPSISKLCPVLAKLDIHALDESAPGLEAMRGVAKEFSDGMPATLLGALNAEYVAQLPPAQKISLRSTLAALLELSSSTELRQQRAQFLRLPLFERAFSNDQFVEIPPGREAFRVRAKAQSMLQLLNHDSAGTLYLQDNRVLEQLEIPEKTMHHVVLDTLKRGMETLPRDLQQGLLSYTLEHHFKEMCPCCLRCALCRQQTNSG